VAGVRENTSSLRNSQSWTENTVDLRVEFRMRCCRLPALLWTQSFNSQIPTKWNDICHCWQGSYGTRR